MRLSFGPVSSTKTTRRVEEALVAGEARVDRVRDDVGDAAPVVRVGEVLLAGELLAGEHVPQAELGLEPAGRVAGDAAGDERLGVDDLPATRSAARRRGSTTFSTKAFLSMGVKTPERLQVVGDHAGDLRAEAGSAPPKSVIAIGIGWKLPRSMVMEISALRPAAARATAPPRAARSRRGVRGGATGTREAHACIDVADVLSAGRRAGRSRHDGCVRRRNHVSPASPSASKVMRPVLPVAVERRVLRGDAEGRAAPDGADRAFGHGAERGIAGGVRETGSAAERSVLVERHREPRLQVVDVGDARRRVPAGA